MNVLVENCISSTVAYYQIFNYFLNPDELYEFLHVDFPVSKKTVLGEVKLSGRLVNGYVMLNLEREKKTLRQKHKRLRCLKIQEEKIKESAKKILIAKRVAKILSLIPTIKLIAISGNLAMMNAGAQDDIDFFIITRRNSVWATRFVASLLLILFNKKRFYGHVHVKDKICLNFFIDEEHLELKKKNLYVAHEIAQMKVLYDAGFTYDKFLSRNEWMGKHLANWWKLHGEHVCQKNIFEGVDDQEAGGKFMIMILSIVEPVLRLVQRQYMKNHITRETVTAGILMFHPRDYGVEIMKRYRNFMRQQKISG